MVLANVLSTKKITLGFIALLITIFKSSITLAIPTTFVTQPETNQAGAISIDVNASNIFSFDFQVFGPGNWTQLYFNAGPNIAGIDSLTSSCSISSGNFIVDTQGGDPRNWNTNLTIDIAQGESFLCELQATVVQGTGQLNIGDIDQGAPGQGFPEIMAAQIGQDLFRLESGVAQNPNSQNIPEASTLAMLSIGLIGYIAIRRRRALT